MLELDDWQNKVLETDGNIVLRSGRQVGKSTVISQKAAAFAAKNSKKTVLVIASVERQAYLLFEKIIEYLYQHHKRLIKKGVNRPTKSRVRLTNGSVIYCLPTGLDGSGIRGYTIDMLIADEAAFINEDVWSAVTPMLAVTKGNIILLSTPFGKGGYFFRCFEDSTFTSFHVSSEDCPRISKEFLAQEKKRMSKLQYAQEYLGEFVDELRQFFPTELIRRCMENKPAPANPEYRKYLGVDVARMGRDDTVFFSLMESNNKFHEVNLTITNKTLLTDTYRTIISLDERFSYKKIFIDDGGLGVGVFDLLLTDDRTKRKTIAINNAARSLDHADERKKKLLKEDLYNNLLSLMEQERILLENNDDTAYSLKSIQAEYTEDGKLKLFGTYSHIADALIRAAWGARDKSLNIYFDFQ